MPEPDEAWEEEVKQKATVEKKAIRRAHFHPRYLGAYRVVNGLVWTFRKAIVEPNSPLEGVWAQRTVRNLQPRLEPEASVEEICQTYARIFCGLEAGYQPVAGWTGAGLARFVLTSGFVRPDLPENTPPLEVLTAYFRALAEFLVMGRKAKQAREAYDTGDHACDGIELGNISESATILLDRIVAEQAGQDLRGLSPQPRAIFPDVARSWHRWPILDELKVHQLLVRGFKTIPGIKRETYGYFSTEEVLWRVSEGCVEAGKLIREWNYSLELRSWALAHECATVVTGCDGTFAVPCPEGGERLAAALLKNEALSEGLNAALKERRPRFGKILAAPTAYEVIRTYFFLKIKEHLTQRAEWWGSGPHMQKRLLEAAAQLKKDIYQTISGPFLAPHKGTPDKEGERSF